MTKYILNSGGLKNNQTEARKFVAEMLRDLGPKPRVLFCFFAEERQYWEQKFSEYDKVFLSWVPDGVKPQFELAFPDTFEQQISTCDVLYIHGGDDRVILSSLSQFDLPNIWKGKIVATNSASTHAMSKCFWTCDPRQCMDGLGILPVKTIAHFESSYGDDDPRGTIDWQKAYEELEVYGDLSLPIYALKEGEFKVIEVKD